MLKMPSIGWCLCMCLLHCCLVAGAGAWAAAQRRGLARRIWLVSLTLAQSACGMWSLSASALFAFLPGSANSLLGACLRSSLGVCRGLGVGAIEDAVEMQSPLRIQRVFLGCISCMLCAWSMLIPVAAVASEVRWWVPSQAR